MRTTKKIKIQEEMRVQKSHEPSWESLEQSPTSTILRTLCWYHDNKNEKDAARYLKCDLSIAKNHPTYAWVSRMVSRGFVLSEKEAETLQRLKKNFELEIAASKVQQSTSNNVVNIQDRLNNKINEYLGELEGFIDDFGINGSAKDCNAYQWMLDSEIKQIHAKKIVDHFRSELQTLITEVDQSNAEDDEAFAGYTKRKLNNIIAVYNKIIEDGERIGNNQKASRKPRKPRTKKAVPADKLIARLNYKNRDDSLKIQSIDPTKIIGSNQLWVFNTKTKKLGMYIAADSSGLSVKGSTILNYTETSIEKTIRKTEEVLPEVLNGGKVSLRKLLSTIRAKEYKLSGRINREVVLLRVT
jgi:hypothetical protein